MNIFDQIAAEREEQIGKGYDAAHDDRHDEHELLWAAVCYIAPSFVFQMEEYANQVHFKDPWPWEEAADKRPYNGNVLRNPAIYSDAKRRTFLIKAAAMVVAEIERMDRAAAIASSA